ncbi:MAG TPA: type VI secretion system tube protein Hcp [Fimbriimonadaceae bacterium]
MTIDATKQGRIYGGGAQRQWDVLSFSWGLSVPYDESSGRLTGRRQHSPVALVLSDYENVAQLLQVIETGENLKEVVISIIDDSTGELAERITLSNPLLISLDFSSGGDRPTESITFTYTSISYVSGNKTSIDDWQAPT